MVFQVPNQEMDMLKEGNYETEFSCESQRLTLQVPVHKSKRQKSILIVDDDAEFAASLKKILSKAGYEVSFVERAAEAFRLMESITFDLIITDYRMGSVSGLDFITGARDLGITSRILLLTAYGSEDVATQAIQAGANGYLGKPVRRDEILKSISEILRKT